MGKIGNRAMASALMAALLCAPPAMAQRDTTNPTDSVTLEQQAGETAATLEEIEVRSIVRRDELQSTSATILENKDIYDRHYHTPIDILKRSPGVSIRQGGDFGVASTVNIRGFYGAHHYGGQLLATVDGIPIHDGGHADGYLDAHIINPLEIESVEIIKGPSSVYYGRHAVGGVAAFQTIKSGDLTRLKLLYDSNNSIDATGIIAREGEKLRQVYSFQTYRTDGWRDNSEAEKYNVSARWSYQFNDKFTASFNVRGFTSDWNSAGSTPSYLPKTASVDDGSGEYAGGERERLDARLWANYLLTDNSQLTFYAYGVDMPNVRYSKSWAWNRRYGDLNGNEQRNDHRALGTGLAYNYKGEWGGREASATLGFDYLREKELRETWSLIWGRGRERGPKNVDQDYRMDTFSAFGEVNYRIFEPLKVRAGLRYDHFSGEMDTGPGQAASTRLNGIKPNTHYNGKARSALSPKFGVVYTTPLEWLDIYANYGRGFLPYMETGEFFTDPDSKMTQRDQYELGFRASPRDWLDFEAVVYLLDTERDVVYNPETERNQNVGSSRRTGIETAINIRPWKDWTFHADYTYQTAQYKKYRENGFVLDGRHISSIPRHITNLEMAYEPETGFGGRVSYNWNSHAYTNDYPATDINGRPGTRKAKKLQDYGSLDLSLNYRFDEHRRLVLDATNILDKDYTSSGNTTWITNDPSHPEGYFVTGWMKPLTVYLGLEVDL